MTSTPALPTIEADDEVASSAAAPPKRRGAKLLFAATTFGQASALLRYVILARVLGPAELGLAATVVVTSAFFDLISDTGSDRFLVQDRYGDTPEVQKLVQAVYVSRGMMIAAALVIFAIPIAHFYRAPRLAGGLALFALAPLLRGFIHLDVRRAQRRLDFRPEAYNAMIAEAVGLTATITAALLTHSFMAVVYGLIIRSVVMVVVTHSNAERPYGLAYSKEHGPRLTRFAAPLVLTGVMLFIGSQSDRVMVGRLIGVKELGLYSAVILLIYYPSTVILRYVHILYVPLVAHARDDTAERDKVSETLGGQTQLLAIAMALGFAVVAPPMVTILYGGRYTQSALLVGLIGILQTTRFLINWPTTMALSLGRSGTVLASNIVRLLVFPGAFIGLWLVGGLPGVVVGFIAGELLSIATALLLLNRNMDHPWYSGFDRFILFILAGVVIVGWNLAAMHHWAADTKVMVSLTIVLVFWLLRREATTVSESIVMARRLLRPLAPSAKTS